MIGLTPFCDNFTHFAGLLMGILFGIMYMQTSETTTAQTVLKYFVSFLSFPIIAVLFMLCLVLLFRRVNSASNWCPGCVKFACVDFGQNWCQRDASVYVVEKGDEKWFVPG